MAYSYVLTNAFAQCGDKPPYNLLNIPVRMNGDMPQLHIKVGAMSERVWIDFPKDGPRPEIPKYHGLPCAGITTDWRLK